MFLGQNAAWWGIFLSIAAIVLTIPLSVISNLLTPLLVNWWAARSLSSLKRRVATLESNIHRYETIPIVTDVEQLALKSLEAVLAGLGILVLLGNIILLTVSGSPEASRTPMGAYSATAHLAPHIRVMSFVATATTVMMMFMAGRINGFLAVRTRSARNAMKGSLDKLKTKLNAKSSVAV